MARSPVWPDDVIASETASRHQPMNWRDSIWAQTRSRGRRSRCVKLATQRRVTYERELPLLSALVQSHAPRMHASSSHWPTVIQCSARKQAGFYDTICESLCVKQSTTRYDMMSPRRIACTASRLDFYSFSGYEFLISTIQFSLVKMFILDIRNWISTSNNGYFGYQQLHFH